MLIESTTIFFQIFFSVFSGVFYGLGEVVKLVGHIFSSFASPRSSSGRGIEETVVFGFVFFVFTLWI